MKWTDQPAEVLLQRSFLFGIVGIVLGTLAILNRTLLHFEVPLAPLNGVSLLLQFIGLSLAVLVLRKRKLEQKNKDKAKKMVLVLAVALLFFILSI